MRHNKVMPADSQNEELSLLADSVSRLLKNIYHFEAHRARAMERIPNCAPNWKALGSLGAFAATLSEAAGGLGMDSRSAGVIARSLALELAPDPYVQCIIAACWLIEHGADDDIINRYLPPVIEGDAIIGFAHSERFEPTVPDDMATIAALTGDAWTISGAKGGVRAGAECNSFVVSAKIEAENNAAGLFLVNNDNLNITSYRTFDGATNADISFSNAECVCRLFPNDDAWPWLKKARNRAGALMAAQSAALMRRLLDDTIEYLKTRKQFGVEIGRFQALQHRAADMLIATEEAEALANLALEALDEDRAADDPLFPATRVAIAKASRKIAHEAIQLHGGMGVSEELFVPHASKRLIAMSQILGDAIFHERIHAQQILASA